MGEITTWEQADEAWDEYLDEIADEFRVGDLTYQPSRVLRAVDPIAYRCGLLDYLDSLGIDSDDLAGRSVSEY